MFNRRLSEQATILVVLAVAATLLPLGVGSYAVFLASFALINAIVAVGLTILVGQAGQVSLASPSFMAIGAYSATYLSQTAGVGFWLATPVAGLISSACGMLLGFPALRLRGFYLAIVTIAFLQITQLIIELLPDYTGGVRGLAASRPRLFGVRLDDVSYYYLILVVAFAMVWFALNLSRSPIGRSFRALHAGEGVAAGIGVNVQRAKVTAFVVSSFYAGIAGALYAPLIGFIDPLEFSLIAAIQHIVFIVIGGLGSIVGALLGALSMSFVSDLLREFKEYNVLVYSVVLLLFLFLIPGGLAGLGERLRSRYRQESRPEVQQPDEAGS